MTKMSVVFEAGEQISDLNQLFWSYFMSAYKTCRLLATVSPTDCSCYFILKVPPAQGTVSLQTLSLHNNSSSVLSGPIQMPSAP